MTPPPSRRTRRRPGGPRRWRAADKTAHLAAFARVAVIPSPPPLALTPPALTLLVRRAYLAAIDRLFRIDARARRIVRTAPPAARAAVATRVVTWRARCSVPLVDALVARATTGILPLPPKSALAVALGYLLGQRASLRRCVNTSKLNADAPGDVLRRARAGSA